MLRTIRHNQLSAMGLALCSHESHDTEQSTTLPRRRPRGEEDDGPVGERLGGGELPSSEILGVAHSVVLMAAETHRGVWRQEMQSLLTRGTFPQICGPLLGQMTS